MHYIAKTSKGQKNKLIQGTQLWPTLTINPRYVIQNTSFHIPLSNFYLFIFFFVFLKKQTQTTQYGMYECNAMQILKAKRNKNLRQEWSPRSLR